MNQKLSSEDRHLICELVKERERLDKERAALKNVEIAKKFGVHENTIKRVYNHDTR